MVFTVPPDLLLPPVNTAVIQSATLFLHLHVCSGGLGAADGDRGARGPPQVCGPVHVTHQGEGLLGPWLGESLEIGHSATYPNPRVLSSEAWGPWRTQLKPTTLEKNSRSLRGQSPGTASRNSGFTSCHQPHPPQAPSSPIPWTCAFHGWHLLKLTRLRWPHSVKPLE